MFEGFKKGFGAMLGVIGAILAYNTINDYIEGKKKEEANNVEVVKPDMMSETETTE